MTGRHDALPPLREVINRYGLRAQKSLGQNFLLDLNLTGRIARVPGPLTGCAVYEVGPGPGGLTRALLEEGAARVIAVERDARCLDALADIARAYGDAGDYGDDKRLRIYNDDALNVTEAALIAPRPGEDIHIVANLPYNVGTALLIRWLTVDPWPPWYKSLTLMFQREVAERIVAKPGSKAYGRLSVLAQWRAKPRIAFTVPSSAFTPPPKVDSAIVHIKPGPPLDTGLDLRSLEKTVEAAFGQRRKMLRASLKALTPAPEDLIKAAGLDPTQRAETLSVADFVRLARCYQDRTQGLVRD